MKTMEGSPKPHSELELVGKSFPEVKEIWEKNRSEWLKPPAFSGRVGFRATTTYKEYIIQIISEVALSLERRKQDITLAEQEGVSLEHLVEPLYKPTARPAFPAKGE